MERTNLDIFFNGASDPGRWDYTPKRALVGLALFGVVMITGYQSTTYGPIFVDRVAPETFPTAPPFNVPSTQDASIYWETNLDTVTDCIPEVQALFDTASERVDQYRAFAFSQRHHGRRDLNMSLARIQRQLPPVSKDIASLQMSLSTYVTVKASVAQELAISTQTTHDPAVCGKLTTLGTQLEQIQIAVHTVARPLMAFGPAMTKVIAEMTEHWHHHGHDGFMDILGSTWHTILGRSSNKDASLYEKASKKDKAYMDHVFEESERFVVDSGKLSSAIHKLQNALAEDRLALRLAQSERCPPGKK